MLRFPYQVRRLVWSSKIHWQRNAFILRNRRHVVESSKISNFNHWTTCLLFCTLRNVYIQNKCPFYDWWRSSLVNRENCLKTGNHENSYLIQEKHNVTRGILYRLFVVVTTWFLVEMVPETAKTLTKTLYYETSLTYGNKLNLFSFCFKSLYIVLFYETVLKNYLLCAFPHLFRFLVFFGVNIFIFLGF